MSNRYALGGIIQATDGTCLSDRQLRSFLNRIAPFIDSDESIFKQRVVSTALDEAKSDQIDDIREWLRDNDYPVMTKYRYTIEFEAGEEIDVEDALMNMADHVGIVIDNIEVTQERC